MIFDTEESVNMLKVHDNDVDIDVAVVRHNDYGIANNMHKENSFNFYTQNNNISQYTYFYHIKHVFFGRIIFMY